MSKERTSERSKAKRKRVPFGGQRYKLQLSREDLKEFERQGVVVRWFNDLDGRIQRAEAGGWQHVDPMEAPSIGHGALHQKNSDLGSKVSKVVSRGTDEIRAYLMKIKKEWYDEDQETKEDRNRLVDESLRSGSPGGNVVENQYVPKGHTQQI